MSYIPQASMDSLNPVKRVRDFIRDVMIERTGQKLSKSEVFKMAGDHLEKLGLDRSVVDRYPHELSGGMKQRVVIGYLLFVTRSFLLSMNRLRRST
jgi:ABC-type dipeptide/oligopeptide/nickel transport system ATPase component